jgi:hypothetical protein
VSAAERAAHVPFFAGGDPARGEMRIEPGPDLQRRHVPCSLSGKS